MSPATVAAVVVTAFVLLPPAYLVLRAASAGAGALEVLAQPAAVAALARTILLTLTVTSTCVVVAVPLAWLVMRSDIPFPRMLLAALALPLAVPSFVGGYVMISALSPGGLVQQVLQPLGVARLPSIYGFWGAWAVLSALSYPYVFLQVCAALRRIDPALEDASRSLGQTAFATFRRVTLPLLRPAVSAGGILVALYVLSEFGAVSMLRYDTLTPLVYVRYATAFDRTSAAVLGLPLIGLAMLLVAADGLTRGTALYHTRSVARTPARRRLGAWRWVAFAGCLAVAALGAGVPLAVTTYWLVRGVQRGGDLGVSLSTVEHTVRAAGAAALLTVLAALPLVWVSVRHRGRLGPVMERAAYLGQSLPAITIALAVVFFAARYVPPLYQTLGLLVVAYAVRFLPEAMGASRTALLQVNPSSEEAARSLGAGALRTFARVTAPQMLPGVSAGALLVFLTAVKELPMTLLLSPIGYDTLATRIWTATSEAQFSMAALPSLLLLATSTLAVLMLVRREEHSS
ncbi:MAG: iron ABC transporter permease [Dehalococcoidia bacterium]|nr:iron ABC transporter permease [Dehalococcoidia bacterium]